MPTRSHSAVSLPCRLLIVEPNPTWREAIFSVASWHFPQVATVEDFDAAQNAIARNACCAVIAEHELPGGSGLALYERARRDGSALLFVLMSSDLRVALSDARFRYLRKPFVQDELSALLRRVRAEA